MAFESQGTVLSMDAGGGSAVTITSLAVGYPTIFTKASHGLTSGTVVTLSGFTGDDAALLNGKTVVVQFPTTNTFAVAIDTTGKTISPGTATPLTYVEIGEVTDWSGPGGSAAVIDKTHLQSTAKEKLIGLPDEGQFTFSLNCEFDDVGQTAFRTARADRTRKHFKVDYADSTTQSFYGYALSFSTSGAVDDKVKASATIEIDGEVITT
jgi:hypothetical protein